MAHKLVNGKIETYTEEQYLRNRILEVIGKGSKGLGRICSSIPNRQQQQVVDMVNDMIGDGTIQAEETANGFIKLRRVVK